MEQNLWRNQITINDYDFSKYNNRKKLWSITESLIKKIFDELSKIIVCSHNGYKIPKLFKNYLIVYIKYFNIE